MRKLPSLLLLAPMLSLALMTGGCKSIKSVERDIDETPLQTLEQTAKVTPGFHIRLDTVLPDTNRCVRLKQTVIPAILYWQFTTIDECQLQKDWTYTPFEAGFYYAADSLRLREQIPGDSLVLKIDSLPDTFYYVNDNRVLYFIFGYVMSTVEKVVPKEPAVGYRFKVYRQGKVSVMGNGSLPAQLEEERNIWKRPKKFLQAYVQKIYDENYATGKRLAEYLARNLFREEEDLESDD